MTILDGWRTRLRDEIDGQAIADMLEAAWRSAAEAVVGVPIQTVAGASVAVPKLVDIKITPPVELVVEMLPGQVVADYRAAAWRLAPHLGARGLRLEPVGLRHVRLTLLTVDPLATPMLFKLVPGTLVLGRDEGGQRVTTTVEQLQHTALQGMTRCVAPWTRIYLPETDEHVRIDELAARGEAITVLAWDGKGFSPARTDGAPFRKGRAELFEVQCSDGATMTVTGQHRFLTPTGWQKLDQLRVGQQLAAAPHVQPETAVGSLAGLPASELHYRETPGGSPGRCESGLHRGGLPLRLESGTAPTGVLLQDDAPRHGDRASERRDVLGIALSHTHRGRRGSPTSLRDVRDEHRFRASGSGQLEAACSRTSDPRPVPWPRHLLTAQRGTARTLVQRFRRRIDRAQRVCAEWWSHIELGYRDAGSNHGPRLRSLRRLRRFHAEGYRQGSGGVLLRDRAPRSIEPSTKDSARWNTIEAIRPAGIGDFYDMTVPGAANYVAEGLVNHNSGKSTALYSLIGQALHTPLTTVTGIDPAGSAMRPLAEHGLEVALGVRDVATIEKLIGGLVDELDDRLAAMPPDRDVLPVSTTHPYKVVAVDELPALLRGLDSRSKPTADVVRSGLARLLSESHKVGFRCVLAAQRWEAKVVGSDVRAQCGLRLTYRVGEPETIKLLHGADAVELMSEHQAALPGVAICDMPGRDTCRIRTPHLAFPNYRDVVRAARLHDQQP